MRFIKRVINYRRIHHLKAEIGNLLTALQQSQAYEIGIHKMHTKKSTLDTMQAIRREALLQEDLVNRITNLQKELRRLGH